MPEKGISHLNGSVLDSVVKLLVWIASPNSGLPWQTRPEKETTSSGFVVSGNRIITNAHCVANASAIRVLRRNEDTRYVGHVVHMGDECDLAMIAVDNDSFWKDLKPCKFGEIPVMQDSVMVVGYPTGGKNICMTAGVVSRIDLHPYDYTENTSELLAIQIDAAVNSGNSGGPAFNKDSKVVGVAFESSMISENCGLIIPLTIVQHFLADIDRNGRFTGICELRFKWQDLLNPGLKSFLGMSKKETGVLVRHVDPISKATAVIQESDVICSIDGKPISDAGTVPFQGGPIGFEHFIKHKFAGDAVCFDIIRDGKRLKIEYALESGTEMHLAPVFETRPRPEYLIVAGMVFLSLRLPVLRDDYGCQWRKYAPSSLVYEVRHGVKEKEGQQIVFLARILTAEINDGYQKFSGCIVEKFNDIEILNLAHLAILVEMCKQDFYVFTMQQKAKIVVYRNAAIESTSAILKRHSIPHDSHILEGSRKAVAHLIEDNDYSKS